MKTSGVNAAVRHLRTIVEAGMVVGLSDGQLLDRFVAQRDEAALEALVLRHGPMVWGVCRRILRDHHDAEDSFQATFLVLARRAAVAPRGKVGNWLYGVAYQTARKARATRTKRRLRESANPDAPEPEAAAHAPRNELAEVLDRELSRLPDKYRTPIVLCELQGRTHGEAAERLGWPVGTVAGRLSRARALLAKRLARHGVSAAVGSLAVLLAQDQGTASAGVPTSLLSATVQAASPFAAGQAAVGGASSGAAVLAGEVIKAMRYSKVKLVAAVLLALTLTGAGLWQARIWAGGGPPPDENTRATVNAVVPEGSFRVTVTEVIHHDDTVVTLIDIEAPTGTTVEVLAEGAKGSSKLSMNAPDPKRTDGLSHLQMVVMADQVETKEGPTNAVKFLIEYRVGKISSSTSEAAPMPAGRQLSDLLTVPITSGEYRYGQVTKLVTFKGATYSMIVTRP